VVVVVVVVVVVLVVVGGGLGDVGVHVERLGVVMGATDSLSLPRP